MGGGSSSGGGGTWGAITGTLSNQTDLQSALDAKVAANASISGGTNTKITYDTKGLVTAGGQAAAADLSNGTTGTGAIILASSPTIITPTIAKLANLTTNGFVKTSGGDGTLGIDTNTYLTANQAITLSGDVTGSGSTAITTTIKNDVALAGNPTTTTQSSSDNSTKIATTSFVTNAITNALNGLDWKPAVGYATTANVVGTNTAGVFTYTSTGTDSIDGHTLVLNDIVLFKNQTTQANNGVWVVTTAGAVGVAGVLTRRSDYNTAADIQAGDAFYVLNGTVNANTTWVQTATVTTINSDALTFSQASGPGSIVSGNGITVTGNSVAIDTSVTVDKTTTQTLTNKTLTSPTLTTPTLGAASATTINKVTLTTPASGSTLTLVDGKTLTIDNSLELAGTDSTKMTFPSSSDTVVTLAATQTLTNKVISLTASPSAGGSSGITVSLTSTETQAIGDAVQINSSGQAHLAKADVIANASAVALATAAVSGSATNTYLFHGILRLSASPSWTVGGTVYLSATGTTGNTLTQTAPSATNNAIQVLGIALAADTLYFNPSLVQVEHT